LLSEEMSSVRDFFFSVSLITALLLEGLSEEAEPGPEPGLSKQSIGLLPELEVTSGFLAAPGAPKECAICLENLVQGESLRGVPCAHYLHRACLDQWLATSGSCPVCRKPV